MEIAKQNLGDVLLKAGSKPLVIDCGVIEPQTAPEQITPPELSRKELDELVSSPVGGQPTVKGWEPPLVTPANAEPVVVQPSAIGAEMEKLRRTIFEHSVAVKTAAIALLKINSEDFIAKTFLDRQNLTLYELKILFDIREGTEAQKPDPYRLADARTPRSGNESITNYSAPNPVSTWGRR